VGSEMCIRDRITSHPLESMKSGYWSAHFSTVSEERPSYLILQPLGMPPLVLARKN
jgi:hypothetical protein